MSATQFSQMHADSRPARAPPTVPVPKPPHHRRPERYPGPTREELGDLAAWLDKPKSSRIAEGPSDPHPATSIRAMEAELWVSENLTEANWPRPEPEGPPIRDPDSPVSDSFLDQLDEIQAALRKRSLA